MKQAASSVRAVHQSNASRLSLLLKGATFSSLNLGIFFSCRCKRKTRWCWCMVQRTAILARNFGSARHRQRLAQFSLARPAWSNSVSSLSRVAVSFSLASIGSRSSNTSNAGTLALLPAAVTSGLRARSRTRSADSAARRALSAARSRASRRLVAWSSSSHLRGSRRRCQPSMCARTELISWRPLSAFERGYNRYGPCREAIAIGYSRPEADIRPPAPIRSEADPSRREYDNLCRLVQGAT